MNVLVIGSGGREHAFCKSIAQSPEVTKVYIAPGNAGMEDHAEIASLNPVDFEAVKAFVLNSSVQVVIVGPEAPLVAGIVDFFQHDPELKGIKILGPDKQASQLEGSKDFAKVFMKKYGIPTASYYTFKRGEQNQAKAYLNTLNPPYVLKADGLAAGKGVLIHSNKEEAQSDIDSILAGNQFGEAGSQLVIEEFLNGIEMSVFVLTDGKSYLTLPEAKDYKRIFDEDKGPNTGGMGSVSPVPFASDFLKEKIEHKIIKPTIDGIYKEGYHYKGFIFIGLMIVENEPFVIEYNVRMGDPETQSVFPRISSSLFDHMLAALDDEIGKEKIQISPDFCTSVVMVSGGYPGSYAKGEKITGLEDVVDAQVFHAGTKKENEGLVTNGGRVLAVSGMDGSLELALKKVYREIKKINFANCFYRKDIGQDLMKLL